MTFVGHLITPEGISFTDEKKNGVKEISLPETMGALKKMLGVANYFRNHVKNLSIMIKPLERMIKPFIFSFIQMKG